MTGLVSDVLVTFDVVVLVYFLVLNTWYLFLLGIAAAHLAGRHRRERLTGLEDLLTNPLTPGVSIILPAHDEAPVIVQSVQAMLALRYPTLEVVVVDDGSTDGTFERLQEAYDLVDVPRVMPELVPVLERPTSVWMPRHGEPLVVVRKPAGGSKTDPLNVGLNLASQPLVLMVDADAVLDEYALLRVVRPFVEDPLRTVAAGGVVRPANGSSFYRGHLTDARMPSSWLARIQIVRVPPVVPARSHRLVTPARLGGHLRRFRPVPPRCRAGGGRPGARHHRRGRRAGDPDPPSAPGATSPVPHRVRVRPGVLDRGAHVAAGAGQPATPLGTRTG